ncbi:MAG: nucleotidyl transferase AbiEii/AbiGii toxin family protein, partial [Paludibacteraceae bacterium]|nr:nucleotidyl transferase AbiEii/AbiGii toxin family protein [Paludibacteraceae bacterium]
MLSLQAITPNTLELLTYLAQQPELKAMRLVGGTALALQYGHRVSVDLDFFSDQPVELDNLVTLAKRIGDNKITNKTNHILQLTIKQVKVDFVDYSCYQWIDKPVVEEGVVLASD